MSTLAETDQDRLLPDAERQKLARTLGIEVAALPDTGTMSPADLRRFRIAASDALFNRNRPAFAKLARATRLLPTPIAAKITEKAIGAFLAGRVASELEPANAVALAERLPTRFLADVCLAMDPGRAQSIVRAMPAALVCDVADALRARGEYIVMANFVEALDDAVLQTVITHIDDDADLLRSGYFVERAQRLEQIMGGMSDDRLRGTLETAHTQDLWAEALALIAGTSVALRVRVGVLINDCGDDLIRAMLDAAQAHGRWPILLEAFPELPADAQARWKALGPSWTSESLAELGLSPELHATLTKQLAA